MITKLAEDLIAESALRPYQTRVLEKLRDPERHGLVAYHSTGAGKTLTALKALEESKASTGKRGLFIVPASLVNNAKKEIAKHNIALGDNDLDVMSYEKAVRQADALKNNDYGMVVFDEAHRLRNTGTQRAQSLRELAEKSDKVLMLTGTAGYNNPVDVSTLVKYINPKSKIPTESAKFDRAFVDRDTWRLKNTDKLRKELAPYVDVYERERDNADFPTVTTKTVQVPMSDKQVKLYRYLEEKLPRHLRKSVRDNLPLSSKDAANLNAFATGIRQASLSTMHHDVHGDPHDSPKLMAAADSMAEAAKAPGFRGVAYSNYLDAGIHPYATLLRERGIEPMIFTGGMSATAKKKLVDRYNDKSRDPRVLLVSSSGGEGLDLLGTRRIQVLEPHFNDAKIEQVRGRGARYKSHAHLPKADRNLLIEEYQSTMPKEWYHELFGTKPNGAIDFYLSQAAQRKKQTIDDMKQVLTT